MKKLVLLFILAIIAVAKPSLVFGWTYEVTNATDKPVTLDQLGSAKKTIEWSSNPKTLLDECGKAKGIKFSGNTITNCTDQPVIVRIENGRMVILSKEENDDNQGSTALEIEVSNCAQLLTLLNQNGLLLENVKTAACDPQDMTARLPKKE